VPLGSGIGAVLVVGALVTGVLGVGRQSLPYLV